MKYETLIKNIKKHKYCDRIIFIEKINNHMAIFWNLQEFEHFIKAYYQNQERFVDFTLTYIRETKELHIFGKELPII